jgi:hypothetical protein
MGTISKSYYALNFFAFGTFSPLNTLSAPTFFPSLGQPYLGPNKFRNKLQDEPVVSTSRQAKMRMIWRELVFIYFSIGRWLFMFLNDHAGHF